MYVIASMYVIPAFISEFRKFPWRLFKTGVYSDVASI